MAQERWTPASEEYVSTLVAQDMADLPPDLAAFYLETRVHLRKVPIRRDGGLEIVFVVAEKEGTAVYYEDIEDGFNTSPLADDGSVATPGHEQWNLGQALRALQRMLADCS